MSPDDDVQRPEPMAAATPPPIAVLRRRPAPWVTWALITANVAVYLYAASLPPRGGEALQAALAQDRFAVADGELWRLFTALFIHPYPTHLAMNMLGLLALGRVLEVVIGRWRFTALYFASGIASGLSFQWLSRAVEGMGASGAVYGLAGGILLLSTCLPRGSCLVPPPRFYVLLGAVLFADYALAVIIEQFLDGIGICTSAHTGGAIAGAFITYLMVPDRIAPRRRVRRLKLAVAGALVLLVGATALLGRVHAVDRHAVEAGIALRDFRRDLETAPPADLLDRWRRLELPTEIRRELGSLTYEALMARGERSTAETVLEEIRDDAEKALERAIRSKAVTSEMLNEVAWYRAVSGTELRAALEYADLAVQQVQEARRAGLPDWFPGSRRLREEESMFVNTRGWVHLLLGDSEAAIADLRRACDLYDTAANHVYLALAYERLGATREAREAARRARAASGLTPYLTRLLAEVDGADEPSK